MLTHTTYTLDSCEISLAWFHSRLFRVCRCWQLVMLEPMTPQPKNNDNRQQMARRMKQERRTLGPNPVAHQS